MAGKTVLGNVDYALQTQTVEDVTHFSLIVTITAPTDVHLNALGTTPLVLLPDRLVSKSSRGSARRVFLHRGWIKAGASPPTAGAAAFVFQDTGGGVISTITKSGSQGVWGGNGASELLAVTTEVAPGTGAYAGMADSKGIRLTRTGTFTTGTYSDITIGLFGVILPTGTNTPLGSSPTVTQFGKSL